jgi:ABC-type multidrug transport system fused ATPase/permease subunit
VPLELQRRIVNRAIGEGELVLLALLGLAYFVTVMVQGGLKYTLRVYAGAVSEDVIRNARRRLFEVATRIARGEGTAGSGGSPASGRAVSVIVAEIDAVGSFVGEGLAEPLVQGGTLFGLLAYMLAVEPLLAGISLAFFAPQVVVLPRLQNEVNRRTRERVRLLRETGDAVADATHAARRDDRERLGAAAAVFRAHLDRIRHNRIGIFRFQYLGKVVVNLFAHLGPLTVLMVGGYLAIHGLTSLGIVVAFVSGFERMSDPARELAAFYQLAATTSVQYHSIIDWMMAAGFQRGRESKAGQTGAAGTEKAQRRS